MGQRPGLHFSVGGLEVGGRHALDHAPTRSLSRYLLGAAWNDPHHDGPISGLGETAEQFDAMPVLAMELHAVAGGARLGEAPPPAATTRPSASSTRLTPDSSSSLGISHGAGPTVRSAATVSRTITWQ